MAAYEYVGNLHVHTPYSDGEGTHQDVAEAALLAGLDFVVFTDHNLLVCGIEGYYGDEARGYILLLAGVEPWAAVRTSPVIFASGRRKRRRLSKKSPARCCSLASSC